MARQRIEIVWLPKGVWWVVKLSRVNDVEHTIEQVECDSLERLDDVVARWAHDIRDAGS